MDKPYKRFLKRLCISDVFRKPSPSILVYRGKGTQALHLDKLNNPRPSGKGYLDGTLENVICHLFNKQWDKFVYQNSVKVPCTIIGKVLTATCFLFVIQDKDMFTNKRSTVV